MSPSVVAVLFTHARTTGTRPASCVSETHATPSRRRRCATFDAATTPRRIAPMGVSFGPRIRLPVTDLATTVAMVVEQCKPHPDYEPPELWSQTREALGSIKQISAHDPWPPLRDQQQDAA